MARSHKPIVWGLFAAGGTVSALIFPVILILLSLAVPLGLLPGDWLSYENMTGRLSNPLVKLIVFSVLFLIVWHAAHRMRITAHDLGIRADTLVATVLYLAAGATSVMMAAALISL